MTTRPKWAHAIYRFVTDDVIDEKYDFPMNGDDDDAHDRIESATLAALCAEYGHEIENDQCEIPEHRFCLYCNRRATSLGLE